MIFPILFDSLLHQPGKRRKHIDRRIDLLVVKLPINEDLSFCDISCQIRNGMSDIVILSYC